MDHAYRTFAKGWTPDADAVNADPSSLLRADNLTLDELGALTLRRGMTCVNPGDPLPDTNINALFSVIIDGVKVRYAAAGDNVYRNQTDPLGPTFDGTGDVAFGSYLGRVVMARGTTKKKHDGTSVSNWGIEMTGGTPDVAPLDTDTKEYASWDATESADHTVEESNGDAATYSEGFDGTPDAAITAFPNVDTGRLVIIRALTGDTDFTTLDGGWVATDDDVVSLMLYASNPNVIRKVTLQIDVNGGQFTQDYYIKEWAGEGQQGADGTVANPGEPVGGGLIPEAPGEPPLL